MFKRLLSTQEFIEKAKLVHGDKYDYSLVDYKKSNLKVKIIYNGVIYKQIPSSHLIGKCPENLNTKSNTQEFIEKAKLVHGDKYDYSLVEYINSGKKVKIIFNGIIYYQKPEAHLIGKCPEKINRRFDTQTFIEKSKLIHGDKYDYSLVNYINNSTKVIIKLNGKKYEQSPQKHLIGKCPEKTNRRLDTQTFIEKSKLIHGDKYDYSMSEYKRIDEKIKIVYNNEVYEMTPYEHIKGYRPEKCHVKTTEDFIRKSKLIHGDKYDYSKVNYINPDTKVIILFNNKEFLQTPELHLRGNNPIGTILYSKGEERIKSILNKYSICFEKEFFFEECKFLKKLPFDFYLKEYNLLIEFDGEQHFYPIEYFGGIDNYNKTVRNDMIKNKFANINNIQLLRIPYTEYNNIENIITHYLNL